MLKDLLSEEQFDELTAIAKMTCHNGQEFKKDGCANVRCSDCTKEFLKQSGIISKSAKEEDQVTEEWVREFFKASGLMSNTNYAEQLFNLKQNNRIRKSPLQEARDKTDEYIESAFYKDMAVEGLIKRIQSERDAADKIINANN